MNNPNVDILFLSKEDVEKVVVPADALEAAEIAFRAQGVVGNLIQPRNAHLWVDEPANRKLLLAMPAYIKTIDVAGIKWTNSYSNQYPAVPAIWGGLIILNHPETGIPFAILDATTITHMRTAGGHAAVAAKYLARKNSKIMTIIGCGSEGRAGIIAYSELFSIQSVQIYDIKYENMTNFRVEMSPKTNARIVISKTPEEACNGSDLILIGTWSEQFILTEPMVPKGCFIAALRRFKDVDPLLSSRADKWVLGNRIMDGDFNNPDIGLSYDNVYADMGEIVTGKKAGRESETERILYTHMGMGAHDVALGYRVYCKAKEVGLGTRLRLI